jgi:PAS domain-containing protein
MPERTRPPGSGSKKQGFHDIFMLFNGFLIRCPVTSRWLTTSRRLLAQGSLSRSIIAPSEETTERKNAEHALRVAEESQFRLIARSQDCVNVLDLQGGLLWMNEGGMQAVEICELGPFVNRSWIQFWKG